MLERNLEKRCVNYAKDKNWICVKQTAEHCRGVPDRLFIKNGNIFFVEFKSIRGKMTELQAMFKKQLENNGVFVVVVSNFEQFKSLIDGIDGAHEPYVIRST